MCSKEKKLPHKSSKWFRMDRRKTCLKLLDMVKRVKTHKSIADFQIFI